MKFHELGKVGEFCEMDPMGEICGSNAHTLFVHGDDDMVQLPVGVG